MTKKQDNDFYTICADILENEKFKQLGNELHHGISRYTHSLRVAQLTYRFTKLLHMKNSKSTTRAALLHDFYLEKDFKNQENKVKMLSVHPILAAENAKKYYNINELEENIIRSHMFPIKGEVPKYKESWIVSLMDKSAAIYEMSCFKTGLALNIMLLFIFNLLTIQR